MKRLIVVLCLLLSAVVVGAQNPDTYVLRIYPAGGTTAIRSATILAASVTCNLVAVAASNVNPKRVEWDDVVNAGKVCLWTDPGTGPLLTPGLSNGNYEATLTAQTGGQPPTPAESVRAPFVVAVAAVPTGVKAHQ